MAADEPDPTPAPDPEPAGDASDEPTLEIERKFLVTRIPAGLDRVPSSRIDQGYLAIDPEGAVVRLRRQGGRTLCAIKSGHGLQRTEEEWRIDPARFERLWPLTEGRRVEKQRYLLPAEGGLTIELDVYAGALDGLATAEVEAADRAAVEAFEPPSWMRLELTDDPRYSNASLALDGAPDRRKPAAHALLDGEAPERGWTHVLLEELDAATDALRGPDAQPYEQAVHTARKAFKRGRALTRIARDGLDPVLAAELNATLRDAGRRLSGARDAAVVLATFEATARRAGEGAQGVGTDAVRAVLAVEHASAAVHATGDAGAIDEVVEQVTELRAALQGVQLEGDGAEVLAAGLQRIHRKGRKALRAVIAAETGDARTEAMHELRKRTKDLWHAAELLHPASPKRMGRLAEDAHALADLLGDDHDLAVLAGKLDEHRAAAAEEPDAIAALEQTLVRRRRKLQRKALVAAEAIYGAKLTALAARTAQLGGR